jgi:hypothetical protein
MRLNPLDPEIFRSEAGLSFTNFYLRRFDDALSWATKSLARQKHFSVAVLIATCSCPMLGRIADAQMMLARLGDVVTISQIRKRIAHDGQENTELLIEACRIAGVPE